MDSAERHATQDLLRVLLVNLIKAAFVPDNPVVARWREDGLAAQRRLRDHPPPAGADFHLDTLWTAAIAEAQRDETVAAEESVKPRLQATCLFDAAELAAPGFDFDQAAERIRISTASG